MAEYVQELQPMLLVVGELVASGDLDQAWMILEQLAVLYPKAPEVALAMGDTAMEVDDLKHALEKYDRAVEMAPDWSIAYSGRAECLLAMGRLNEARHDIELALALDQENPQAHWVAAILFELEGKKRNARIHYRKASQLAPDVYHMPTRLSRTAFDNAVRKAIERLPDNFRERIENEGVEICIKDLPDLRHDFDLDPLILGAFDGYSLLERYKFSTLPGLPPRICLYQMNIERMCRSEEEVIREIEVTILHEVGHYFGLEDEDLKKLDLA